MIQRVPALLAFAAALAVLTCDSGPVAGELTLSLSTPNSDDGAVLLRVTTTAPNVITAAAVACSNCRIFAEKVSDTELRAVVTGALVAGPLARVSVSDVEAAKSYTVEVLGVASRAFQLRSTGGYGVTVP